MEASLKAPLITLTLAAALVWSTTAAIAIERPSVPAVAAAPNSFIGKQIAFRNAPCASDPKAGFVCRITAGGHTLRIEAGALGISGGDVVGELLIGPCKGLDKIGSPNCRFDVEIEPRSAQTEAVMLEFEGERVTRLYTGDIEMRAVGKRSR